LSAFGSAGDQRTSSSGPKLLVEREAVAESAVQGTPPQVTPFPAVASPVAGFAETITEGALAKAPIIESAPEAADTTAIMQAVCAGLGAAGHVSAAQWLGTGKWELDGSGLRIEVAGMGKKMLALTVNAAAEKIIRQELQRLGAPARFLVAPGEGGGPVASAPAAIPAGSVHEAALNHPLVQRAREIFNAEVRSVVDLHVK
jgi:DNA polymerase-3 subunit gamma/tau